jgi:F0F1-type ATP synthase assembly protein I
MPSDSKPDKTESPKPELQKVQSTSTQLAIAMELPFTLVGAIVFGGALGYFLDRWLHTRVIFTLVLGGLGFFAGVREVVRRLPGSGTGKDNGSKAG